VIWYVKVYHQGHVKAEAQQVVQFEDRQLIGQAPITYSWKDAADQWGDVPGFLEMGFQSENGDNVFTSKRVVPFYAIYYSQGKKSLFSDNAYKYGSPPVIAQIAEYGQFVDGYPVAHIDRARDLGMSIILINPYSKAIMVRIISNDGRSLDRLKVMPMSASNVPLIRLLKEGENSWIGQIQLTANNRLITFVTYHSIRDPRIISDHEHLDPYRGDPTHMPAFQWFRQKVGRVFANHGISWNNQDF